MRIPKRDKAERGKRECVIRMKSEVWRRESEEEIGRTFLYLGFAALQSHQPSALSENRKDPFKVQAGMGVISSGRARR